MVKKCPPGTICIENNILLIVSSIIIIILFILYFTSNLEFKNNTSNIKTINDNYYVKNNNLNNNFNNNSDKFNSDYNYNEELNTNTRHNSVLLDPHMPPYKNNYNDLYDYKIKKLPINIKTQNYDTNYSQVGILTRITGNETILPLMGRKLFRNRDKWNYYTMNDKNNMIKLPITFKNKKCMSDQGCDDICTGDKVFVDGYKDLFQATIYDNNSLEYIPYL
jgi:hypothetical protein